MPQYPWFFEGKPDKPNKRGFAMLTYLQWLGSWLDSYPYYEDYQESPITKLEADLAAAETETEEADSEAATTTTTPE